MVIWDLWVIEVFKSFLSLCEKASVLCLSQVSLYPPLSSWTSWLNIGFKTCQSATLSDPSVCLPQSLFRAFWVLLKYIAGVDQWRSDGHLCSSHNTQRHTWSIVWHTGLISVHSPTGLVGKPLSGVNNLCGVIMYSLWWPCGLNSR